MIQGIDEHLKYIDRVFITVQGEHVASARPFVLSRKVKGM